MKLRIVYLTSNSDYIREYCFADARQTMKMWMFIANYSVGAEVMRGIS